jgi:hypothetical protein
MSSPQALQCAWCNAILREGRNPPSHTICSACDFAQWEQHDRAQHAAAVNDGTFNGSYWEWREAI